MLGIFAQSLLLAARMEPHLRAETEARLRREDEEYLRQGRRYRMAPPRAEG
ncbi:hypothetical protein [Gemmobacter caeruleus]|uniref:hypothetical protein n=1 Tax=Gemmobacter caeruleus TaxID=2595004 RepID=UPI001396A94F|nr:hypothetical protein [Gemmobacter caeruleus]